MYKEGQIVEVRLSADNADELNRHYGIDVCCAQIIGYEKPFDWDTVKPGMAFIHDDEKEIVRYIGPSLSMDVFVCVFRVKNASPVFALKSSLTRTPEHDIEVPK